MQEHFKTIDVELDDGRQQLYYCAANGKLYRESEIEILAAVLKGTDITEVYSPEKGDETVPQVRIDARRFI
jgi:hypothetical protein